jgi:hypothetical protein
MTLTDQEKVKRYEEMVEKRKSYSKKHYYRNKKLVELGKELLKKREEEKG